MNLRALQTFLAIVDHKSFREAARHLILTQSNISMQMKTLEQELGVALFDRQQRPPAITVAGLAIVEPVREMVALEKSLSRLATQAEMSGEISGRLNVGAIPTAEICVLADALKALQSDYPNIKVFIQSGLSDSLPLRVLSGELNAAIITQPDKMEKRLNTATIFEEPLVLIFPKQWKKKISLTQLHKVSFVRFNRRMGVGRIIDRFLIQSDIETQDGMELDSVHAIINMVVNGLGVSIVPLYSIAPHQRSTLHVKYIKKPSVTRRIALVTRAQDQLDPLCGVFLEALRAVAPSGSL